MEKNEVSNKVDRGVYCIFEGYRFLNLYLQKFIPNAKNTEMLDDPSFLSSEEEYEEEKIHKKDNLFINDIKSRYFLPPKILELQK
jgi:hypothetical protein